jgi:DUF4097 and DUF4098 domain-containing protein YvlB
MRSNSWLGVVFCVWAVVMTPSRVGAGETEDRTERTFEVKPGGKLRVQVDRGSVTVSGGDRSTAEVEVVRRVVRGSAEKARKLLEGHQVRLSQEGEILRVEAGLKNPDWGRWIGWGPGLEVSIRVLLPREFDVAVETGGGSVSASNLKGESMLKTSGGSIRLEQVEGQWSARTSGGSIRARGVVGMTDLNTAGGSIKVEGAGGSSLKASTSGGSLELGGIAAPAAPRTPGGPITIETSATPLSATTSGGSIQAAITQAPKESVDLKTSAGGISLILPAGAGFELDASTSAGGVSSEIPVSTVEGGKMGRSSLRGTANGGGPRVKLRTSAGSIRVKTP